MNQDGYVGGFGYSKGPMGGNPYGQDGGDFLVRILDPKGQAIHSETTRRKGGFAGFGVPYPSARRLVFDGSNDRMVIVMPGDTLRIYRLGGGTLECALPAVRREEGIDFDSLAEIRFIPDSRLMLLRYSCDLISGDEETFGSRFVVNDEMVLHLRWYLPARFLRKSRTIRKEIGKRPIRRPGIF